VHLAQEVDPQHPVELGVGDVLDPAPHADGGRVHRCVDPAEPLLGDIGQRPDGGRVGHVGRYGDSRAAPLTDLLDQRVQRLHAARGTDHAGTFGGEPQRGGAADAAGRSDDDDDLAALRHLQRRRAGGGQGDEILIQERHPDLEAEGHAHGVDPLDRVVRQHEVRVQAQHGVQGGAGARGEQMVADHSPGRVVGAPVLGRHDLVDLGVAAVEERGVEQVDRLGP
jgi:hypothetical protein